MSEDKKTAAKKRNRRSKTTTTEEEDVKPVVEAKSVAPSKKIKSETGEPLPMDPPTTTTTVAVSAASKGRPTGKSEATDAYVIVSICDSYTPSVAFFSDGKPGTLPSNGWTEAAWRKWVEENGGVVMAEGTCDPTVYSTTATYTLEELASGP